MTARSIAGRTRIQLALGLVVLCGLGLLEVEARVVSRVNVASDGTQSVQNPRFPGFGASSAGISADGRIVAFNDNAVLDRACLLGGVYVHDRATRTTTCVRNGGSFPAISADGRYVVFTDHGCGATFGLFRHDRTGAPTSFWPGSHRAPTGW